MLCFLKIPIIIRRKLNFWYNDSMVIYNSFKNPKLTDLIKAGGIGVIPTDTIYGIVCSAFDAEAVDALFAIKGRSKGKPPIILISQLSDIGRFGVKLTPENRAVLDRLWPGRVSVVLPYAGSKLGYLSRGQGSLTFRLPDDAKLLELIRKTGPLVAPSANPEGLDPATDIDEIMTYFVGKIDFAVDGGHIEGNSSTLVRLTDGKTVVLRQGDVQV